MPNEKEATAAHACSCGTSIVCMAQMGAMSTAGAAAGTMGTMGAVGAATAGSIPFITLAFQAVGLGFLLTLSALFYQALLIAILAFTIVSSYFSYRLHKRIGPFTLAAISSLVIYGSIYLLVSEYLYWIGFALMFFSGVWNYVVTKKRMSRPNSTSRTPTQPLASRVVAKLQS